jgi:hypothetical protein
MQSAVAINVTFCPLHTEDLSLIVTDWGILKHGGSSYASSGFSLVSFLPEGLDVHRPDAGSCLKYQDHEYLRPIIFRRLRAEGKPFCALVGRERYSKN